MIWFDGFGNYGSLQLKILPKFHSPIVFTSKPGKASDIYFSFDDKSHLLTFFFTHNL